MHSTTWSTAPTMGLAPLFHHDPAVGGPPLASPDGHWWWDGDRWAHRAEQPAVQAAVQPDVEPVVELVPVAPQPADPVVETADSPAA